MIIEAFCVKWNYDVKAALDLRLLPAQVRHFDPFILHQSLQLSFYHHFN